MIGFKQIQFFDHTGDREPIRIGCAALPLLALAGWWGFIWLRRLRLKKWSSGPLAGSVKLSGASGIADTIPREIIREMAREMCRRVPRASRKIASAATAVATARNADYFSPIYATVNSPQEYVVLIENNGARDQQAQYVAALMSVLVGNGAYVTAYYYTGDPRLCTEVGAPFQTITLEETIARHTGEVLWVFGSVRPFIDPITGEPPDWAHRLAAWQRRYLFDSSGPKSLRLRLAASGFHLLPMDLAAIRAAVSVTLEDGESTNATLTGGELPAALLRDVRRLFAAEEPDDEQIRPILSAIRRFLGPQAYDCLSACALLPQLSFQVTLWMARRLGGGHASYLALEKIVRLPWMRYGLMPDWLRQRLVSRMPPALLDQAKEGIKAYLEAARPVELKRETKSVPWIECARPERRREQGIADFIYLGALWGFRPDQLAAPSPGRLSRILFQRGYAMFGPQPLLQLAAATLLAATFWVGASRATEPPQVHGAVEDPFLRRVREVAQSQIGKTPATGLWRSPFADWVVDQAAQLLTIPTPLLTPSFIGQGMPAANGISSAAALPIKLSPLDTTLAIGKGNPPSVELGATASVAASDGLVRNSSLILDTALPRIDVRPQSEPPRNVAVVSTSSNVSFAEVGRFAAAMQKVVDGDLKQYWGVRATVRAYSRAEDVPKDAWMATIEDRFVSDHNPVAGMASFHSDTNGRPNAFISMDSVSKTGVPWTLSASHEIFEMLVDPFGQRYIRGWGYNGSSEILRLAEICDPVWDDKNADAVDGVAISDFVTPRWFFDPAALPGEKYDRTGAIGGPRQLWTNGYSMFVDATMYHTFVHHAENSEDIDQGAAPGDFAGIRKLELGAGSSMPVTRTPATPPGNPQRGLIVWVDDHPENNTILAEKFNQAGYQVDQVTSTSDALKRLGSGRFDAVISDMTRDTPDAGLRFLKAFRAINRVVPFYAYTSSAEVDQWRQEVMQAGGDGITTHPDELFNMVLNGVRASAVTGPPITTGPAPANLDRMTPRIDSVQPDTIRAGERTPVTITGRFPTDSKVVAFPVDVESLKVSSNQIIAVLNVGTSVQGKVNVTVTSQFGNDLKGITVLPVAGNRPATPANTHALTIRVVDAVGQPVSGPRVVLSSLSSPAIISPIEGTASYGNVIFILPDAVYQITVSKQESGGPVTVANKQVTISGADQQVTVELNVSNAAVSPASNPRLLKVHVVDAGGQPVARAAVRVANGVPDKLTLPSGDTEFNLPAAAYTVSASLGTANASTAVNLSVADQEVTLQLKAAVAAQQTANAPSQVQEAGPPAAPQLSTVTVIGGGGGGGNSKPVGPQVRHFKTPKYTQDSKNDDISKAWCGPDPGSATIDPETSRFVVDSSRGDWKYSAALSQEGKVCFQVNTVHHTTGTSGRVTFHFEYDLQPAATSRPKK
jgi:CheY-like chemotaxis protein